VFLGGRSLELIASHPYRSSVRPSLRAGCRQRGYEVYPTRPAARTTVQGAPQGSSAPADHLTFDAVHRGAPNSRLELTAAGSRRPRASAPPHMD
jgi:hypothetical protein